MKIEKTFRIIIFADRIKKIYKRNYGIDRYSFKIWSGKYIIDSIYKVRKELRQ